MDFSNRIKKYKFLVTGGAGFIGSHIAKYLIAAKAKKVVILDNLSYGKKSNLDSIIGHRNLEFVKGDIRDKNILLQISKKIDYISHQAALRSVPDSVQNPLLYNEVNVTGTLNVLLAAYENRIKRVVFASSSSVYGETKKFPEKEIHKNNPISPYALTKLIGEHYCSLFNKYYNIETVSLRYFNVYGPYQSLENKYSIVIPKFITSLLDNHPNPIFGNGTQKRDFTYINDVVLANIRSFFTKKAVGEIFNIGSGNTISVIELSKKIQALMNIKIKSEFFSPRPGDVQKTMADITKAKKILDYKINFPIDKGLKYTIEWFKKNKKLISQV